VNPGLEHYLVLSALIFSFGVFGLLTRRNLVAMLLCVELVLNAAALNFVAFHRFLFRGDPGGVVFPILIIAVAAAEAAVALAVVISLFRHRKNLDARAADTLSG
jgi:NADH:ubiquinone oxidoreductase subunit K